MRSLVFSLLLAAVALYAQEDAGGPPKPIPAAVKARLASLAPEIVCSAPAQFYSSNLYELMDGGADAYLMYNMVGMAHRECKSGGVEITADIFDLGDTLAAFGIYAAERAPDYEYIRVGAEGYVSDLTLNFFEDRFYVKLSAFGEKEKTRPALMVFARAVADRIGTNREMPALLGILPKEHRVAKSEKYVVTAPLGHDFLAPAVMASYSFQGKETLLLFSQARSVREASERVELLRRHFEHSGKVSPDAALGTGAFQASDAYQGNVVFFARGTFAVLCVHPPAEAADFLKNVLR